MTNILIRGVPLFVKTMGKGYPLLLMHGGPGQDHASLHSLESLADQFTLIFYDHRCNGRSEWPDISSMSWENLTADPEVLREQLGFEKWAVLGHSFGGQVAIEYALRYPQSLSHLILMDTGADQWWVQQNAPRILARQGYRRNVVQAAVRFFNGQLNEREYFPTVLKFFKAYSYRFNLVKLFLDLFSGPRTVFHPEATIYGYSQLLNGWSVMDRLGEINIPSLVMAGRHDFLFPPEHQAIMADRLQNAKLVLIERAGHNPHMEQPKKVIKTIREFLSINKSTLLEE